MVSRLSRWFRHRWTDDAARTLPSVAWSRIHARIAASETQHTGEIRVCVESGLPNSYVLRADPTKDLVRQRALALFGRLRVWDTEHNNGVLIYLCMAERAIELVADRGINQHVSPAEWSGVVRRLSDTLRAGHWEAGLGAAVDEVNTLLVQHFPCANGSDNPNELPDAPVVL